MMPHEQQFIDGLKSDGLNDEEINKLLGTICKINNTIGLDCGFKK